ncbi:MAG: dihydrodipicolinate synthase family protein, partial [Oscillospiraceae bacterium]|nr:dihydrodipicolinate synthase family protein [Oscillospiraceae bacterium]
MKNTIFTGAAVAIVTPMNADGSVNFDKLGELIDFNLNNGTDAIVICGTTGEGSTLSDDEHVECIKYAI